MNLKGLTVLICDDSILFRKQMKDFFTANNCTSIIEVTDGQEAIDAYKENKPDIVFLDIIMPNKTGIEAIKEIISYDSNAYIVMFSSAGTHQYLKDAILAGAHDFLQKPFDPYLVETIIEKYFLSQGGN
ncbi:response regulator [Candidatus Galacturonibacter soehngenii]|uniref:Stage 0 sporulation protein A homolog n=1 Tax=Candidatus Galacturonatibacter soehngenii TaxID=2307010 RepID=A0A7V7UCM8_9FIRM|nr:response regulator [Candidatus Galacturonibacter soehngenii]KAB1439517.1 response regulator [Candidatus Galacturonibacter soehngenii]MBA4687033.1 response regulator [Candidatus Galacturonibacter soehngenii]